MTDALDYRPVLRSYGADCQPRAVEFLAGAGGFSGSRLWRLDTPRGTLSLRRWPAENPTLDRLEFIQAVLWHVVQEGFDRVPLPLETTSHAGYVRHAGHLWELAPWLPGRADYHRAPSRKRLEAALTALAEFHFAAASFPLAETTCCPSPGIGRRHSQLASLRAGGYERLRHAVALANDEYSTLATRIVELFPRAVDKVQRQLANAMQVEVPVQPCLRDIWHENVLFVGEAVTGLIDFDALRPENVAADVARLLGSLVEDDSSAWQAGLAAYESVRPLAPAESSLVATFDASGVLLGGINWLTWLYEDRRAFDSPAAVQARLAYFCRRLGRWVT